MEFKYTSIILSKHDISETDRIYNFYTKEDGTIHAIGRGVRKAKARLAGNLEPLTLADVFVSKNRGMGTITGVIPLDNFVFAKMDLMAIDNIFFALSHFDKLITGEEKDEKIFLLLLEYFMIINKLSQEKRLEQKAEIITLGFLFNLAGASGYKIITEYCVNCEQKICSGNNNFFSAKKGGMLCVSCAKIKTASIRSSDSCIKLIRIFSKNKISSFPKLQVSRNDIAGLRLIWKELFNWISG
jgi:DNA repair protein RecO (recombination protein O)